MLARKLEQNGIVYTKLENAFLWMEDFARAHSHETHRMTRTSANNGEDTDKGPIRPYFFGGVQFSLWHIRCSED
jgi:hypothetical protein